MGKERDFVYVGDPIPKIENDIHANFLLNYQKSILNALLKKNLLTPSQCERCLEELERKQKRT